MSDYKPLSDHPFWLAVEAGDTKAAAALLAEEPDLVRTDFRPAEKQDPHTFGFPLVHAVKKANVPMIELLLDHGADINAKSLTEDQREFGSPIMFALEQKRYDIMNLLLDRGASVDAYGYCYPSLVDLLCDEAFQQGAPIELARPGLDKYLGKSPQPLPTAENPTDVVKLFQRVVNLGGQPSMLLLVRCEYYGAIEELLRTCPESPSTPFDHPPGTIFETLCNGASWQGVPRVLELARAICPQLYRRELSLKTLYRAIRSHNRERPAADYLKMIEAELQFLKEKNELQVVIEESLLLPHFILAKYYLYPGWCGVQSDPSTPENMIELSELFISYGFTDLNKVDPETGKTALAMAESRSEHEGLDKFAEYLRSKGALP